ncbi:hypothetical protein EMPS_04176 [Entomortierella parvispora]|uniref:Glycosyltransferase family 49 protein n=1 Tax=Entomortierella parvispora TaxID=205924 RepID=A0A9P3H801_9FUNG|nr:hypothetical protein EMPS_04176 [Entomortierella parvispora]
MYKPPKPSSLLPTSASAPTLLSPTFRANHPLGRLIRSRLVRTVFMAYVGFCALFTLKHIVTYESKPEPIVYKHYDLERTYDADKPYSVVSELSTGVILSKMFTFSTPDLTDNIQPFFVRSESTPRPEDITLATFVPQDNLSELIRLVEHFPGPISVVMHVDHASNEPGALNPISRLHTMLASHPKIRAQVDVHLITSPQTHRKPESTTVQEQSNLHRNIARFFARTDFVLLMEADGSMPMTDVAKSFKERPQWMEKLRSGNVFVLPGFDVAMVAEASEGMTTSEDKSKELVPVLKGSQLPRSKDALLTQVHESQMVLSEKTWKRTIRNVDYNTWATQQSRLSSIQNYDPFFAPSVILRRDKMLWCPERFGNNQAACLFELYLSGADFWVLPNDFTVNSGERKEALITEREKTINTRLYQKFHEESCLKHARAFYAAGEWDSDRARHCRISCQKVLAVWGLVIRQA